MGILNKENTNLEASSIDQITSFYYDIKKNAKNNGNSYIILNLNLICWFLTRYDLLYKNTDLKDLKERIEHYNGKEDIVELKKKFDDIITASKNPKQKAEKESEFYDILIANIMKKNKHKGNHEEVCEEIINSRIISYIKYEKQIINLKDKIKELILIYGL